MRQHLFPHTVLLIAFLVTATGIYLNITSSACLRNACHLQNPTWLLYQYFSLAYMTLSLIFSIYFLLKRYRLSIIYCLLAIILLQLFLIGHPFLQTLLLFSQLVSSILILLFCLPEKPHITAYDKWGYLITSVILIQAFFGSWTNMHYHSLICPDFPFCQAKVLSPIASNIVFPQAHEIWLLDTLSRLTSYVTHRYFAIITTMGMIAFIVHAFYHKKTSVRILLTLSGLILLQVILGIFNIIHLMPTEITIAHSITGLLLLLTWIGFIQTASHND